MSDVVVADAPQVEQHSEAAGLPATRHILPLLQHLARWRRSCFGSWAPSRSGPLRPHLLELGGSQPGCSGRLRNLICSSAAGVKAASVDDLRRALLRAPRSAPGQDGIEKEHCANSGGFATRDLDKVCLAIFWRALPLPMGSTTVSSSDAALQPATQSRGAQGPPERPSAAHLGKP